MFYRRVWRPGGTYFFTINLSNRKDDLLVRHIDLLRRSIRIIKARHPFTINAWVVLPDHMHCVIRLPPQDADFALRIRLIKRQFSLGIPRSELRSDIRLARGERGIWQRRFWEHFIKDERDFWNHINYVHFNPVKHGLVANVREWPHSTFHRFVADGLYTEDWYGGPGD